MATLNNKALRETVKEAVIEALQENRDLLLKAFREVLEDFALAEAIREGRESEPATHDEVAQLLKEPS